MTDRTLAAMAERAASTSPTPSNSPGTEGGSGAPNLADDLAELRSQSGLTDLVRDTARLAETINQGQGNSDDARALREEIDSERSSVSAAMRDTAARLDASRAAQIAAALSEAQRLSQLAANGEPADSQQGQQGLQGQGSGTEDSEAPGGAGGGDHSGNRPGAGRRDAWRTFRDTLERLNDSQLQYVITQMRDYAFNRDAIPLLKKAEERLLEMLTELPGSSPDLSVANRIPDEDRREIEDYYRNLSDDFGERQLQSEPFSQ